MEKAIEVKDLNVIYQVTKAFSVKKSLFSLKKSEKKTIHAVKDLSFSIDKGEILGIVGRNGCGKSTLLKTIAGIFSPDSGTIETFDNSISLLSIGIGFNREVSGRENILLSGMLLGFSEDYINARTQDIIRFSELGRFIDMPVRTYSSGMYSKLAFAVTAILETDILLVDEVLSVGDPKFRRKSYNKMVELISDQTRTAIIVSHQVATLKSLCTKLLWMDSGKVKMFGPTEEILPLYQKFMAK